MFRTNAACYSLWYEEGACFVPMTLALAFGARKGLVSYRWRLPLRLVRGRGLFRTDDACPCVWYDAVEYIPHKTKEDAQKFDAYVQTDETKIIPFNVPDSIRTIFCLACKMYWIMLQLILHFLLATTVEWVSLQASAKGAPNVRVP